MKCKHIFSFTLLAMILGGPIVSCASTSNSESTGQYVDSSAITTKVKTALLGTKGLNSADISVETYKGTVQLSGFVDNQTQKTLAVQVAGNVKGVKKVINNLIVKN
jgi:osmotically-inducible protein OsmY